MNYLQGYQSVSGNGNSQRAKIPDWVPIYPTAKIENLSFRDSSAQRQFSSFSFMTQDSYDEVMNFYKAQFHAAGWKLISYPTIGYYDIIAKLASNGRTITVNVSKHTKDEKPFTKTLVTFEEMKP